MTSKRILLRLVKLQGPDPLLDFEWLRAYRAVLEDGTILRRVEIRGPNRKGVVARRSSGWVNGGKLPAGDSLESYRQRMETIGFKEIPHAS